MNDPAAEARWADAFLRDVSQTAGAESEDTTSAPEWSTEPWLPLVKGVQRNTKSSKYWLPWKGTTTVDEPARGVEELHRSTLREWSYQISLVAITPDSWPSTKTELTSDQTWGDAGYISAGQGWLFEPARPEPVGSILQGKHQYVEVGGAVQGPHNNVHLDASLLESLADFDNLSEAEEEDDLPPPDPDAVKNARFLLQKLYTILPVRYRVTPTERRGVAIDAPMKRGAAVAVECAPDDAVYCFATINGNSRRAKFYQMDGLPDVFIEKALRDLAAG